MLRTDTRASSPRFATTLVSSLAAVLGQRGDHEANLLAIIVGRQSEIKLGDCFFMAPISPRA